MVELRELVVQAETSVLAQMQLKQQHDAAAKECDGLRSQLAAPAAAADEVAAQHTAKLEACRQTVSTACVLLQSYGFHCAHETLRLPRLFSGCIWQCGTGAIHI